MFFYFVEMLYKHSLINFCVLAKIVPWVEMLN